MASQRNMISLGILALSIFLSLVWYKNFEIVQITNAQDLTFMNLFRDQQSYPDGFLFKQTYPLLLSSVYYWVIGWLGTLLEPYWVLYGYFIFTNCLVLGGLFYLAHTITQNITASFLAVFALSLQWQLGHALGGSGPLGLSPAPLHMATGILLFAISCFLQYRHRTSFVLAGIAFNIHASLAIFALTMFVVALLVRRQWRVLAKGCVLACIVAIPTLVQIICYQLSINETPLSENWYHLVRLRSSHHTMPSLFGFDNWSRFIPYLFLFPIGYRMAVNGARESTNQIYGNIALLTFGILLLCLAGTIFSEWLPIVPLIELTLYRSTRFFVIFAVILYFSVAARSLDLKNRHDVIHIFLMAGLLSASFPLIYASLLALGLAVTYKKKPLLSIAVASIIALAMLFVFHLVWQRYDSHLIIKALSLPLFLAILCLLMIYSALMKWKKMTWPHKLILPVLLALTVFFSPVYPLYSDTAYFTAAKDLQYWLKDHTSKEHLIIFPPDVKIWSGLSERGDTFTFNELAYQIYAPSIGKEVISRAKDYVEDPLSFKNGKTLEKAINESYAHWDEAKFRAVAAKYQSGYAVVYRDKSLSFPLRCENERFRVYEIN